MLLIKSGFDKVKISISVKADVRNALTAAVAKKGAIDHKTYNKYIKKIFKDYYPNVDEIVQMSATGQRGKKRADPDLINAAHGKQLNIYMYIYI